MRVDVVFLPRDLRPEHLDGRAVVVFDVLRATTSMAAALAAGAREIRIFPDIASASAARKTFAGAAILCGEKDALPPPGFDVGNSPPHFTAALCEGRTLFTSTTNGTVAILSARGATALFIGALVNASATARAVAEIGINVTLLCAGTNGKFAMEDLLGCGAVLEGLHRHAAVIEESDAVRVARMLFESSRHQLISVLRDSQGGRNVLGVNLAPDIDFAGSLDRLDVVGRVVGDPPVVVAGGSRT